MFSRRSSGSPNPQVELTAKQRSRCFIPVMLRMPAAAHLQRSASFRDSSTAKAVR